MVLRQLRYLGLKGAQTKENQTGHRCLVVPTAFALAHFSLFLLCSILHLRVIQRW